MAKEGSELKSTEEQSSNYNLQRHQVPWQYQENYILSGYRLPEMTTWGCIKTLVQTKCNETLNIWTHFCPFFIFAWILVHTIQEFQIDDPFYWPLFASVLGIMGFCVMSTLAHTFSALSTDSLYTCFYMDYAFISIYTSTGWMSSYFYTRPLDVDIPLFNNVPFMAFITMKIALISTFQCCCTFRTNIRLEHAMRVSSFVIPWLNCAFFYLCRFVVCKTPIDCDTSSLPYFGKHVFFVLTCAIAISARIPERFWPGTFDVIGQSHQIMHVSAIFSSYYQLVCVKNEMLLREDQLRTEDVNNIYSKYTFHFLAVVIILNVLTVYLFQYATKTYKEYFNNTDKKTE